MLSASVVYLDLQVFLFLFLSSLLTVLTSHAGIPACLAVVLLQLERVAGNISRRDKFGFDMGLVLRPKSVGVSELQLLQ